MKCKNCEQYCHIKFCQTDSKDLHYIRWHDGQFQYTKSGFYHREDGPATDINYGYLDRPARWYLNGVQSYVVLKQELHVKKTINIHHIKGSHVGLVTKKINDYWYEILLGDEKKLVVSLYKYKE